MHCRICGNDQFEILDKNIHCMEEATDETLLKCSDCGHITTKKELIEDNIGSINANIEDIEKDAIKEFEKELNRSFKKIGQ